MRKGFTLIELLIVIAIIGLLATLAIVSLTTAQQKARDTKRVADLKQLQNAVELYFSQGSTATYPDSTDATWVTFGADIDDYITTIPVAPNNSDTDRYVYATNDTQTEYVFLATLEDTGNAALDGDDDITYTFDDVNLPGWTNLDAVGSGGTDPVAGAEVDCSVAAAYCISE
ncbi:MAG: type II secretion system protein [Candidatus Kerfeldbacteria bacterium]|nr:type II secretion system protein [Candidatus Kerfeldbacteria bacterium]